MRKGKRMLWHVGMFAAVCATLSACSKDTEAADPYANWESRNSVYLDSIANVSQNPPSGEEWQRVLNYKLWENDNTGGTLTTYANTDYVYMKMLPYSDDETILEGETPLFTDSVEVHYRGSLINGTVFDESYSGDWDSRYSVSTKFAVSGVVIGWQTALQVMKEGQRAEVYIPYSLAYGTSGSGSIPGYSLLIFDLRLEKVKHPAGPDDRSRKAKAEIPTEE